MITNEEFDEFRRFLKIQSGLDLPPDKLYLAETRLMPVVRAHGFLSVRDFLAKLREPAAEALREAAVEAMTNNESLFFRDRTPFESFTRLMLPQLVARRPPGSTIRIWCAAASSGQEPYSLAMLVKDQTAKLGGRRVEILATDLSGEILERARDGIYSQFEVQRGLPVQYLVKYFQKIGDNWQIVPELRQMVQFRKLNLLKPFLGLGTLDIVFCRNVLIYFDGPTKVDVLERIARIMQPDGFLILGGAETVTGLTGAFSALPDQRNVFVPARLPRALTTAASRLASARG